LFTARLGFSIHKFDFTLWGRNLGDTKFISYAYDFGAVHLGNPRLIGATAKIRF
jgi:iron complex outermembrane recepter protein